MRTRHSTPQCHGGRLNSPCAKDRPALIWNRLNDRLVTRSCSRPAYRDPANPSPLSQVASRPCSTRRAARPSLRKRLRIVLRRRTGRDFTLAIARIETTLMPRAPTCIRPPPRPDGVSRTPRYLRERTPDSGWLLSPLRLPTHQFPFSPFGFERERRALSGARDALPQLQFSTSLNVFVPRNRRAARRFRWN
jgi:hypothetical protein